MSFADADPEDAWDASDPALALFDNLAIRVRPLLEYAPDVARVARWFDDLATVRERIRARELD